MTLHRTPFADRARGAFWGLAVGDALGTTLEFCEPGSFTPIDGMIGGGPFNLPPGAWTDDTSMAACLAESLIERRGFDAHDQMTRYLAWYRSGLWSSSDRCFDIGNATRAALERFERDGNPQAGSTDPHSAGNGSLMRLAPIVVAYAANPAAAVSRAMASSTPTHAARACVDACGVFAAMLVRALHGDTAPSILNGAASSAADLWPTDLQPDIAEVAHGSYLQRQPPEIVGSGYVVRSLEAALWAVASTTSYRDAVLAAANLGDDADTTAAIAGQLAGALYGASRIPPEWLSALAKRSELEALLERLLALRLG